MSTVGILLTALGLSMDAFAVAIAAGVTLGSVSGRQVFRFGFHFGLFQAMMPVLGWLGGQTLAQRIERWDHWAAFFLLSFVGAKAIYRAGGSEASLEDRGDPTRGLSLVILSTATSIDALAVGLSFAFLQVTIWYPCAVIGIVTAAMTTLGMVMGSRLGMRFGRRVEMAGGLVLIGIGLKILMEHLMG